jgi:uncharacterized protein YgbK (DUF1537 family)
MSGSERGVILADDATGALECASILAGLRLAVTVSIGPWPAGLQWEGILVVDLESRNLPAGEARALLGDCLTACREQGIRAIYLKTDSTLRGNLADSLIELAKGASASPVVYVPAYPKLGRTVRGGRLFVNGVPLDLTAFAADIRHPARSSFLMDLFSAEHKGDVVLVESASRLRIALRARTHGILVCDAETEEELAALAGVVRESAEVRVAAGPSGFVSYWASMAGFPCVVELPLPVVSRWLVICGSLHPQSRKQVAEAAALGVPILTSDPEAVMQPEQAASALAQLAVESIRETRPDGILIMGGDTAFAVWKALGVRLLQPMPEALPGVAACCSPELDLVFVTKAGGFGDDGLVKQVMERFQ